MEEYPRERKKKQKPEVARVHFIAEARRTSANKYNRKGGNQRTYVSSPYWYNHRFQAPAAETDYAAYHPQASKPALFFLKIPRRVTKTRKNEKKKKLLELPEASADHQRGQVDDKHIQRTAGVPSEICVLFGLQFPIFPLHLREILCSKTVQLVGTKKGAHG